MTRPVSHLFVCTHTNASGKPACGRRGSEALIRSVQRILIERGAGSVFVTPCGCLGPCFDGPNAVVYPDGVWYGGLDEADAEAIVEHLLAGVVYNAKRVDPPGS
ncbi:MAG: putative ferredoxin [Myxococcales bacterium]|nr:putative ferredoxin [Myxococcales bacterium]